MCFVLLPAAGSASESSRYLAALCCLDLRQYTEAESLLIGHGQAQVQASTGTASAQLQAPESGQAANAPSFCLSVHGGVAHGCGALISPVSNSSSVREQHCMEPTISDVSRVVLQVPNGAAGWYLLGRINRLTGRPGRAAEFYSKALQLDPMLWVAFAELCMLGEAAVCAGRCAARGRRCQCRAEQVRHC